jgi:hypothetical protein
MVKSAMTCTRSAKKMDLSIAFSAKVRIILALPLR